MASCKNTLILAFAVIVLLTIGTCVFTAIEKNSYEQSFSLSMQIITTIGYGNVPPKTTGGKVFCIFFELFGIPSNLVLLQKIGQHMLDVQKSMIIRIETAIFKREPQHLAEKCFLVCFLNTWVLVFLAAGVQIHVENWSYLDGVYCFLITFTTVGFGDLIPGYNPSNRLAGIIIWPCFVYIGLCAMSNLINCCVECIQNQQIRKLIKQRKATVAQGEETANQG